MRVILRKLLSVFDAGYADLQTSASPIITFIGDDR